MQITVALRAHRGLRKLARYRPIAAEDAMPLAGHGRPLLAAGEAPIGIYENVPGLADQSVLITDRGVRFARGEGWLFLPYEQMVAVEFDGVEKSLAVAGVVVRLRGGSSVVVPILGGDAATGVRDAFAMLTFLGHVIGDLGRRHSPPATDAAVVHRVAR